MRYRIFVVMLAAALLFGGCAGQKAFLPDPVTTDLSWILEEPAASSPTGPDEVQIQIHLDNTQSIYGFAGLEGALVKTMVHLTDQAYFDDAITTWTLEPREGSKTLEWQKRDPRFLQATLVKKDNALYTIKGEDLEDGAGGPMSTAFSGEADPNTVKVVVTDLLEQENSLSSLVAYTRALFASDSHQQLRLYLAKAPYDGRVSFPVILSEKEQFAVKGCEYKGNRPFVIIAAGPASGVERFHEILSETGVKFTEFMVENQRTLEDLEIIKEASPVMTNNIFVSAPSEAKCSLDVESLAAEDCFAFRYRKYSAQKENASRVSLLIEVPAGQALTLGDLCWWEWVQPASGETLPEGEETTAPEYLWLPCAAPSDAVLELRCLEPGTALSDRGAEESGIDDIVIPSGKWVYELSILMEGENFLPKAYAVEAALTTGIPGNSLAAVEPFREFSTSFSSYGLLYDTLKEGKVAEEDKDAAKALRDGTLSRIPDLELLLKALADLDADGSARHVETVRIILQNY